MRTALDLSPRDAARFVRLAEHAPATGLVAHLLALSLLFPERSPSAPHLDASLSAFACAQRERCARLFVRAPDPVAPADVEDAEARVALVALGRSIAATEDREEDVAPSSITCVSGGVARDRVVALLDDVERAPLGSALPWMLAAEILGDSLVLRGARSNAPAEYRAELLEAFGALSEQSPEIFLQRLVRGEAPALRRALRAFGDAVRGAAAIEVA